MECLVRFRVRLPAARRGRSDGLVRRQGFIRRGYHASNPSKAFSGCCGSFQGEGVAPHLIC